VKKLYAIVFGSCPTKLWSSFATAAREDWCLDVLAIRDDGGRLAVSFPILYLRDRMTIMPPGKP
jgi:hypothetical protein